VHRLLLAAGCLVLTGCGSGPSSRSASSPTPSAGAAATAAPVATPSARAPVRPVGHLPSPLRDAAAATAGARTLFAGGGEAGTGSAAILRILPSGGTRPAGRLAVGTSDVEAAAVGGQVLIAGGTSASAARREVYRFDPRTRRVRGIGRLPQVVTHALSDLSAGSFRDHVTVVGGRDAAGRARDEICSLRPRA
jgi:Kelch motif